MSDLIDITQLHHEFDLSSYNELNDYAQNISNQIRKIIELALAGLRNDISADNSELDQIHPLLIQYYSNRRYNHTSYAIAFYNYWVEKSLFDYMKTLCSPMRKWQSESRRLQNNPTCTDDLASPTTINSFKCWHHTEEVNVRFDQALASSYWGNGFLFSDHLATKLLITRVAKEALKSLIKQLYDIDKMIDTYSDESFFNIEYTHNRVGTLNSALSFERLICDVLNEDIKCCRQAPLHEDIFQKTDLRIRIKHIKRQRGLRIQVALSARHEDIDKKTSKMPYANEIIMVSPWSLASALNTRNRYTSDHEFWKCFPNHPATPDELAEALKKIFIEAIERSTEHPFGPMGILPCPIKQLIREYVNKQAGNCHWTLRRRESTRGRATYKYRIKRGL